MSKLFQKSDKQIERQKEIEEKMRKREWLEGKFRGEARMGETTERIQMMQILSQDGEDGELLDRLTDLDMEEIYKAGMDRMIDVITYCLSQNKKYPPSLLTESGVYHKRLKISYKRRGRLEGVEMVTPRPEKIEEKKEGWLSRFVKPKTGD